MAVPIYLLAINLPALGPALVVMTIPLLLGAMWHGPVYATVQSIVEPEMRAVASAVILFVINLIGLGLGPLCVGLLSDVFAHTLGLGAANGVRWALCVSALLGLVSFGLFWKARETIGRDMAD